MKKILILSGKGGTGKTTVATAIIKYYNCKAFADCDVDAPNLHLVNDFENPPERKDFISGFKAQINENKCISCGKCLDFCRFGAIFITNEGKFHVSEYFCEGCGVCKYVCPRKAITLTDDNAGKTAIYKDDRTFSTAELKIGRGNSGKLVTEVKKELFKNADNAEFAVFDGSPGVGCPVMASLSGMNLAVVVTEPTESGIHDLKRISKTIENCFVKQAVCVNKYDVNPDMCLRIEDFCKQNGITFLGKIPYDKTASKAVNEGKNLVLYDCEAGKALRTICEKVKDLVFEENEK